MTIEVKITRKEPAPPPIESVTLTMSEDSAQSLARALDTAYYLRDFDWCKAFLGNIARQMHEQGIK